MSVESVVTAQSTCNLFGVLVRTLTSKVMVMSLNADVSEKYVSDVLCAVQRVIAV